MTRPDDAIQSADSNEQFGASEPQSLLIDRLVLDPAFQVREKLDAHAIKRYAAMYEAGHRLDPIRVADVGGLLIVIDGWHRIEAMKLAGREHATAVVTAMSRDDAAWEAANANASHGVQLRRADYVNVFKFYVRSRRHIKSRGKGGRACYKSYRDMAKELPFPRSHVTIRNWMFKYFPGIARQISDEDVPVATGGLRDATASAEIQSGAEKLAGELLSHFQSLSSVDDRKEVVRILQHLLIRLEVAAGLADEPEPEF